MQFLQTYSFLDHLLGLDAVRRRDPWTRLRAVYISLSFVTWFTLSFVDFVLHVRNFNDVGEALIMVTGHSIVITIYWRFLFNHDQFILLLDEMQTIVDESVYSVNNDFRIYYNHSLCLCTR